MSRIAKLTEEEAKGVSDALCFMLKNPGSYPEIFNYETGSDRRKSTIAFVKDLQNENSDFDEFLILNRPYGSTSEQEDFHAAENLIGSIFNALSKKMEAAEEQETASEIA